jgi:hypothetical protein
MDYSTASSIRGTKLTSLIADRIMSGGSVGSSIKGAISDRMKAKAMGAKERYDPLNIAKKLTGGGSLAPALLGRMMGRSKEDIQYFAGKGTATALGHETGNIGGGSVDVLNRILSFLQKSHEVDVRTMEVKKNFQEEAMNEDDRRHKEFLNALKAFTSGGTATPIGGSDKTGGGGFNLFDSLSAMLDSIPWLSTIKKMIPFFGQLVRFFTGPLGMAIIGILSITEFASWLSDKIKLVPDMSKLTPQQAANIIAENNETMIRDYPGGLEALKKLAGSEGGVVPELGPSSLVGGNNNARPGHPNHPVTTTGNKLKLDQERWDKNKSPFYNEDGTLKSSTAQALPAGNSTAGAGRGSAEFARTDPRLIGGGSTGPTPMTSMAPSSGVAEATNANIDLNLEQTAPSGGGTTPIVTNTTNNMGNQKSPASTTASQRDSTDILLYIYGALNKAGFI